MHEPAAGDGCVRLGGVGLMAVCGMPSKPFLIGALVMAVYAFSSARSANEPSDSPRTTTQPFRAPRRPVGYTRGHEPGVFASAYVCTCDRPFRRRIWTLSTWTILALAKDSSALSTM